MQPPDGALGGDGGGAVSRGFSESQREYLREVQADRCRWCGKRLELHDEVEADHVLPFSDGGPTDPWNGQLLHRRCHLAKRKTLDGLRDWQREFVYAFDGHPRQAFLLEAPVGAGKTRAGVAAFNFWRRQDPTPICVVIAPSVQIIRGWATEALSHGKVGVKALDPSERQITTKDGKRELLRVDTHPSRDTLFWLATYQSLGGLSGQLHRLCRERPVFVILDEIHHVSSSEEKAWGEYTGYAFDGAQKILCTTATPWRTDREAILHLNYESGLAVPDYQLRPRRAIHDGLIVPTEFTHMDGDARWRRITAEDEIAGEGMISDEETADVALSVAVQDEEYQDECLREARRLLDYKRQHEFPDATCLVFAYRNETAASIASRLNGESPGIAVVATRDTPDAHRTIDAFRNRATEATILVACGMASEGCDIPHVKVIAWLTNTRTSNEFVQRVGRGVRAVGAAVTNSVVLPAHPELHRLAVEWLDLQGPPLGLRELEDLERDIEDRKTSTLIGEGVEGISPRWFTKETGSQEIDDEAAAIAAQTGYPSIAVQEILFAQRNPAPIAGDSSRTPEVVEDPNKRALELREACRNLQRSIGKRSSNTRWRDQYSQVLVDAHSRASIATPQGGGLKPLESMEDEELERLHKALLGMADQ